MKQTGTDEPTPEQLLQIIDAQLAGRRSQNVASSRNRAIFVVGGLIFILVAASVALLILEQLLSDYRQSERQPQAATATAGNF